jgi:pyruvate dehydrogenase E2 component (dihydrolipoamide acetyltransferase)
VDVVVPDLGDFADVEIIDVLVKPGDAVQAEQGLITLETEKATMDVPAPAAGRVGELKVKVGDRVSTGHVIMSLEPEGGSAAATTGATPARGGAPAAGAAPARDARPASAADSSARPAPAGNGTPRVVTVPDLGDFAGVEIIDVLVKPGDRVAAEQGLVTLETEKASMDVPAPEAGEIVELKIRVGDKVSAGDPLLLLRPAAATGAAPAGPQAAAPQPAAASATSAASAPAPSAASAARKPAPSAAPRAAASSAVAATAVSFGEAHASPSVRKLARELGVELGRVRGSGHKNRVTAEDVKAFVKEIMQSRGGGAALPAVPVVDFARYGPIDTQPLTRIQKISGPRLHASWVNIPHVTQHDEADITDLEEKRAALKQHAQERGIKLTPLAFIIRACVLALDEMPLFKSSLAPDGESLIMKRYTHIGFAADTPNGLLVPVIRDADKKDVYELAQALAALSERARAGRLQADDIQGAVFTVSSLGGIGGRFFSPIINAPEVAILGVSRSEMQPKYRGSMFVPRLMLPLSLSYDHRVIDGAKAVRFTTRLGEILADPSKLVEATP